MTGDLKTSNLNTGKLYIVGTPIGNLGDMSERGKQILSKVTLVAAEDTRIIAKLLAKFNIRVPVTSFHEHNSRHKTEIILERLAAGEDVALVSDAGMPVISDPGYDVVACAAAKGYKICVIPGPCAAISALAASGFPSDKFVFEGFLPNKGKERRKHLSTLSNEHRTIVFYEAPHRLKSVLNDFAVIFGENRRIVIAREMTKIYEEYIYTTVVEAISRYSMEVPRGEFVIVVEGIPPVDRLSVDGINNIEPQTIKSEVQIRIASGINQKEAISIVAKELHISKRKVYSAYHGIREKAML